MRIRGLTIALCGLSIATSAQENPLTWFPLQVGSHWVYQHEWKSGDRNRPSIDRWTSEETVTTWVTIPEGIVVLRDVKELVHSSEQGLTRRTVAPNGSLRPEFRKHLSDGSAAPDFCFPLETGREWGSNDNPWRVEPSRESMRAILPSQYSDAIHIRSNHFGSGGLHDVWFQQAVGVVEEHYIHNGTYDEYTKKLLSFSRPGQSFRR